MTTLRFVLGDHLTRSVSSLADIDRRRDVVLMVEVWEETSYVPHHKQKIAFILSAMRHFANELRAEGIAVDYVKLDDPANTGSFTSELLRAVARYRPDNVVVTEPGEWRVLAAMQHWQTRTGVPVHIREDDRFFVSRDRFARWASRRKTYRMEHFYREMRRETGLLMEGGRPVGGRWNFDADNRKRLPAYIRPPPRRYFEPDMTTVQVLALVEASFSEHFGNIESFGWPVTRSDALSALEDFVSRYLPQFGTYQDAMRVGEPFLYHALLSAAMNVGLLTPREVCARAELAYLGGHAPLNAIEGFIRQILGWREFIRGVYWQKMPAYAETNALGAQRDLPWFYWSGETSMRCLALVIEQTRRYAYSHHIQRLMVTGNFALLAGVQPRQIEEWYLSVYVDAFEWVELPNTYGMAMFADGGLLSSKPYAASGAYIDRMSDFCSRCEYDPKLKSGPRACPFNQLYWAFLIRHESKLSGNPRMRLVYRNLAAWPLERRADVLANANRFLEGLSVGPDRLGRTETKVN